MREFALGGNDGVTLRSQTNRRPPIKNPHQENSLQIPTGLALVPSQIPLFQANRYDQPKISSSTFKPLLKPMALVLQNIIAIPRKAGYLDILSNATDMESQGQAKGLGYVNGGRESVDVSGK